MNRLLRLGAPALALALIVGCGAPEAEGPGSVGETKPAPGGPAVAEPSKDGAPAPAPTPSEPAAPNPSATEVAPPVEADPKADAAPAVEGPKAEAVKLSDDEIANIKKLPADEQEAAIKQGVCPVSGGNLGMDVPIKMTAEGRSFYICCEGCKDAVEKDPKAVLAKLDKK